MSSVITSSFHNSIAEDILSEITANFSRYYYYFGNTTPAPTEPETPLNNHMYIAKTRNSMITLLQVSSNDVSLVLDRINWETGTRYNKYDCEIEGVITNFYVITDEFNVYKCLDNDVEGTLSIVKPTGSDVDPIVTADGYKWKFMYNVPLSMRNKFMTAAYIPVSTGLRNRFFSDGEIDSVIIEKNGIGYTQPTTSITVTGDGSGADISPIVAGGQVVGVTINNPGTGYSYATLTVTSSLVTDPDDEAVIIGNLSNGNINSQQALIENLTTPGTIDSITVKTGGSGFTVAPTVTITGDGDGATATAYVINGSLTKIEMTNVGSGYTFANVILGEYGGATGFEVYANPSPPLGHGRNAVKELYANTLMFYGNMTGNTVNGFPVTNDYQQFGLIKDIRSKAFNSDYADYAKSNTYAIYCEEDIAAFNIDDQIYLDGGEGSQTFIIKSKQVGGTMNALEVVPVSGTIPPQNGIVFTRSGGAETITSVSVKYQPLVATRTSTFCYTIDAVYDDLVIVNDTILTKTGHSFIVVATKPGRILLQPLDGGTVAVNDTLSFGAVNIIATAVITPTVDKNTGELMTIDNRASFFQSPEQSVSTRTVIRF
jgi:hypothetical protein